MDLTVALEKLSKMLASYYRVAPIIIDEYDTPIQEGYSKDFYNEIIDFILKEEEMERFAADALRQIDEKRYDAELIELGAAPIFKLGIAFSGKRVKVKTI